MPLTSRQKRRLAEKSRMIESADTVAKDMADIQIEYAKEIDSVVENIRRSQMPPEKSAPQSTDVSVFHDSKTEPSDSKETTGSTKEHQSDTNFEPEKIDVPEAPIWAKRLWKNIAKNCHPDRLNFQELSAIEVGRRQQWFLESRKYFETQDWNRLLHIGVQLGEFVDEISHVDQHDMLTAVYNDRSKRIDEIQTSLAWKWGTLWDRNDVRIQIITVCCRAKGVVVPPIEDIVRLIVNLELE